MQALKASTASSSYQNEQTKRSKTRARRRSHGNRERFSSEAHNESEANLWECSNDKTSDLCRRMLSTMSPDWNNLDERNSATVNGTTSRPVPTSQATSVPTLSGDGDLSDTAWPRKSREIKENKSVITSSTTVEQGNMHVLSENGGRRGCRRRKKKDGGSERTASSNSLQGYSLQKYNYDGFMAALCAERNSLAGNDSPTKNELTSPERRKTAAYRKSLSARKSNERLHTFNSQLIEGSSVTSSPRARQRINEYSRSPARRSHNVSTSLDSSVTEITESWPTIGRTLEATTVAARGLHQGDLGEYLLTPIRLTLGESNQNCDANTMTGTANTINDEESMSASTDIDTNSFDMDTSLENNIRTIKTNDPSEYSMSRSTDRFLRHSQRRINDDERTASHTRLADADGDCIDDVTQQVSMPPSRDVINSMPPRGERREKKTPKSLVAEIMKLHSRRRACTRRTVDSVKLTTIADESPSSVKVTGQQTVSLPGCVETAGERQSADDDTDIKDIELRGKKCSDFDESSMAIRRTTDKLTSKDGAIVRSVLTSLTPLIAPSQRSNVRQEVDSLTPMTASSQHIDEQQEVKDCTFSTPHTTVDEQVVVAGSEQDRTITSIGQMARDVGIQDCMEQILPSKELDRTGIGRSEVASRHIACLDEDSALKESCVDKSNGVEILCPTYSMNDFATDVGMYNITTTDHCATDVVLCSRQSSPSQEIRVNENYVSNCNEGNSLIQGCPVSHGSSAAVVTMDISTEMTTPRESPSASLAGLDLDQQSATSVTCSRDNVLCCDEHSMAAAALDDVDSQLVSSTEISILYDEDTTKKGRHQTVSELLAKSGLDAILSTSASPFHSRPTMSSSPVPDTVASRNSDIIEHHDSVMLKLLEDDGSVAVEWNTTGDISDGYLTWLTTPLHTRQLNTALDCNTPVSNTNNIVCHDHQQYQGNREEELIRRHDSDDVKDVKDDKVLDKHSSRGCQDVRDFREVKDGKVLNEHCVKGYDHDKNLATERTHAGDEIEATQRSDDENVNNNNNYYYDPDDNDGDNDHEDHIRHVTEQSTCFGVSSSVSAETNATQVDTKLTLTAVRTMISENDDVALASLSCSSVEEQFDSVSVELWSASSSGVTCRHRSPSNEPPLIDSEKNQLSDDVSIPTITDDRKTTLPLPVVDTAVLETFVTNFIIDEPEDELIYLDEDQVPESSAWVAPPEQLVYSDQPRRETIGVDHSCCVSVFQESSSLTTTNSQKNFAVVDSVTVYEFAEVLSFFSDVTFVPVRRSSMYGIDDLSLVAVGSSLNSAASLTTLRDIDIVDRRSLFAVVFGEVRKQSNQTVVARAAPLRPSDTGIVDEDDDRCAACYTAAVVPRCPTQSPLNGLFTAYLPQPPMTWTWASRTPSSDADFRSMRDLRRDDSTSRSSEGNRQRCLVTGNNSFDETVFHYRQVSPVVEQCPLPVTADIFTLVT